MQYWEADPTTPAGRQATALAAVCTEQRAVQPAQQFYLCRIPQLHVGKQDQPVIQHTAVQCCHVCGHGADEHNAVIHASSCWQRVSVCDKQRGVTVQLTTRVTRTSHSLLLSKFTPTGLSLRATPAWVNMERGVGGGGGHGGVNGLLGYC